MPLFFLFTAVLACLMPLILLKSGNVGQICQIVGWDEHIMSTRFSPDFATFALRDPDAVARYEIGDLSWCLLFKCDGGLRVSPRKVRISSNVSLGIIYV